MLLMAIDDVNRTGSINEPTAMLTVLDGLANHHQT